MNVKIAVGTLDLVGPAYHHYAGYETASWWTDYALAGGSYPVYLIDRGSLVAIVPGTVIADHFVNRLLHLSSNADNVHVGTTRDVWLYLAPDDPRITYAPGWTVDVRTLDRPAKPAVTWDWPPHRYPVLVSPTGDDAHMVAFLVGSGTYGLNDAANANRAALVELLGLRLAGGTWVAG